MGPLLPLETERLILRRFCHGDLDAFVAYRSDPEIARYQSWTAPYPAADGAALIAEASAVAPGQPGSWLQIAIERKDTGDLAGDCAFCVLAEEPTAAEIGFTLARAHQRHGFATEAVSRLVDALLCDRGLERVQALCDVENATSVRLLERLGMTLEGRFADSFWDGEEWRSEFAYAIVRERWQERRQGR